MTPGSYLKLRYLLTDVVLKHISRLLVSPSVDPIQESIIYHRQQNSMLERWGETLFNTS